MSLVLSSFIEKRFATESREGSSDLLRGIESLILVHTRRFWYTVYLADRSIQKGYSEKRRKITYTEKGSDKKSNKIDINQAKY